MQIGRFMAVGTLAAVMACGSSSPTQNNPNPPPPGPGANVTIKDYSFSPETVTVKVGGTVTWTNNGPSAHTSTADSGMWDSGQLSPVGGGGTYGGGGGTTQYTFTFTKAGTYTYHCSLHPPSAYPKFVGTVIVTQ